jgi:hypothetical protein
MGKFGEIVMVQQREEDEFAQNARRREGINVRSTVIAVGHGLQKVAEQVVEIMKVHVQRLSLILHIKVDIS